MFKLDDQLDERHLKNAANPPEFLEAENVSLRLLLAQAEIDARELLAQAGIDAKEREAAAKLQKLILEELHHRIKNTLATVSAPSPRRAFATYPRRRTRNTLSKAACWRSGGL